ncbi:type III toxin-antitoxin system ToxN/AbiQ family toxin [Vibrio parahaemolyticus]|nr:type III toxin-antitoxin system ToxN/AbiQ family toxin [Vibrio parahaemolyticus]
MKLYTVSDDYLSHLRRVESKVPGNNYARAKPYIGVVLEVNNKKYLAPLTSPKFSVDKFKSDNPTLFKLHALGDETDKLGAIRLLYMIPVLDSEITEIDVEAETDQEYKGLLAKQIIFIRKKEGKIRQRARRLYNLAENNVGNFAQICCNFKALEAAMEQFGQPSQISTKETNA